MNYKDMIKSYETQLKILYIFGFVPDTRMLHIQYKMKNGRKLNLKEPKPFNDKLQWLKLNNQENIRTQMVDKLAMRKIAEDRIGREYLVPLFGQWRFYDQIDFDKFTNQFVMKCFHDSGGVWSRT